MWSDDPDFDIDLHVRAVIALHPGPSRSCCTPSGGSSPTHCRWGDPSGRPPLVTGLLHGKCALVIVFHHVLADGIGGLAVLGRLVDGAPGPTPTRASRGGQPSRRSSCSPTPWPIRAAALNRLPAALGQLRAAGVELGTGRPAAAPRTSLNRPIGRRRAVGLARIDLTACTAAAHRAGRHLNDAVVPPAAGALRTVLARRGEQIDDFVFSLPVSARRSTPATDLGNQVGVIAVAVPTAGAPAARRLAAIAPITRGQQGQPIPAPRRRCSDRCSGCWPGSASSAGSPNGSTWSTASSATCTARIGQLTFLGAGVVEVIGVPMTTGNISVAFSALSYAGRLTVTVLADPDRCPDLRRRWRPHFSRNCRRATAALAIQPPV